MEIEAVESKDDGYSVSVAFYVKNGNIERYTFQMRAEGTEPFAYGIYGMTE